MDLDSIGIRTRMRNAWESIDLGFAMASAWFWPLFLCWLIPAMLIYVPLRLVVSESFWVAITVVWWCKPLLDRAPLYIASRRLFNEQVPLAEALRQLPSLYQKDCIAWLTWRRLSTTRSFDMPVTVLESLKHAARSTRLSILHREIAGAATWLTIVCVHLELVIIIGAIGLAAIMIPDEIDIDFFDLVMDDGMLISVVSDVLTLVAMALVAPFYTLAGFSLYLNRRIKLEAWDIEIRFRHIAARINHSQALSTVVAVLLLLSCATALLSPQLAYADDEYTRYQQQSAEVISEVLAGTDFHHEEMTHGWRLKDFEDKDENANIPDWFIDFIRFLEQLFGADDDEASTNINFAVIIEAILWLSAVVLALYLLVRLGNKRELFSFGRMRRIKAELPPPEILFGLDVRASSIPADLVEQTKTLWASGQQRAAVGLLYRATLSVLMHRYAYRFKQGDTEHECAQIVSQNAAAQLSGFVNSVTQVWQQVAYAHTLPDDHELLALCDAWPSIDAHA